MIYSIGHSTREIDDFISILKRYEIKRLMDIRSFPYSKYVTQYNTEALAYSLITNDIDYVHFPVLGGKRKKVTDESINLGWRNKSFRNFADYMQTRDFEEGIKALIEIAQIDTTCIMCTECVPWKCHRSLVSDSLLVRGVRVIDILSIDKTQEHKLTVFAKINNLTVFYPEGDNTASIR